MNDLFTDGFEKSAKTRNEIIGVNLGAEYLQQVEFAINQANLNIGKLNNSNLLVDSLKGYASEIWHADTFNIDAALNGSHESVWVAHSNKFASSDINSSWGENFGLKYYQSSNKSAKAQSISYEGYFRQKAVKESISEYYSKQGISDIESKRHESIYKTQKRLVPSDQFDEIKKELTRKALREDSIRPNVAENLKETQKNLVDRIKSPDNNHSIPLSEKDAKKIATDLKEGNFDGGKYGLTTKELIKFDHIVNEAIKAGITASVITFILKSVPDIVGLIEKKLNGEDITLEEFAERGFANLSVSTQSFLRGSVAATLCITFNSGIAGEFAQKLDPIIIGVMTAVTLNIIENSIKLANGSISRTEFSNECLKDMIIGFLAGLGSISSQLLIPIPVIGLLIGNIVGSMVGVFAYSSVNKVLLKLGTESGLTYFHLIEQDYTLPSEVLEFMGLKVITPIVINPKINLPTVRMPIMAQPIINKPKRNLPYIISRDIIGINKIGYLVEN